MFAARNFLLTPPAPVVKQDYTDNFNRANNASLGSNWVAGFGALAISSNTAIPTTLSTPNYNTARWVNPVNTDDQQVTLTAGAVVGIEQPFGVILGASSAGVGAVGLWYQTNVYIQTVTGLWGSSQAFTGQATAAGQTTPAASDTLTLKRVGNVYTCYHNGTQVLTWTDSSDVLTRGSSNRYVGLTAYISSAGNYRQTDAWEGKDV